jgi:hypothetical protein
LTFSGCNGCSNGILTQDPLSLFHLSNCSLLQPWYY